MFIYYAGKIVNPSEGCMLWSQFLFELSLLAALLGLIENRSWSVTPIPFLFGAYAMLQMMGIINLCVDTLLALVPIAGFALILGHRDRPRAATFFCALFSALAVNVKSSGIFFAVLLIGICFLCFRNEFSAKELAARCVVPPLAMYILWSRHVDYAFANAGASRHAISLAYFRSILSQKSAHEIAETIRTVLGSFVLTGKGFLSEDNCLFLSLCFGLLLLVVLAVALYAENVGEGRPRESWFCRAAVLLIGVTAAYEACLILFYIVSLESGKGLNSYWRYAGSGGLCVLGVAVACALSLFNSIKTGKARGCAAVALIAVLCMTFYTTKDGLRYKDHIQQLYRMTPDVIAGTDVGRLEEAGEALGIQDGKRILAYDDGDRAQGQLELALKYVFLSGETTGAKTLDDVFAVADQYDYLIIWDASEKDLTPFLGLGEWLGETEDIAVIKIHGDGGIYGG